MKRAFVAIVALVFSISLAGVVQAADRVAAATASKPPARLCVSWDGGVQSILTFKNFRAVPISGGPQGVFALHGIHVGGAPLSLVGTGYVDGGVVHFSFTIGTADLGILVVAQGAGTWDLVTKTGALTYTSDQNGTRIDGGAGLTEVDCGTVSLHPIAAAATSAPADLIRGR